MKYYLVLLALGTLSACSTVTTNGITPTVPQAAGSSLTPSPVATTPNPVPFTPTAVNIPVGSTSTPIPSSQPSPVTWAFKLLSPLDGEVVDQPEVDLKGSTNLDAVMTVNDDVYLLTGGEDFSIPISLVEGPNSLEIVVSDYAGEEIDQVLGITYQP
jgi:hypothetical protein